MHRGLVRYASLVVIESENDTSKLSVPTSEATEETCWLPIWTVGAHLLNHGSIRNGDQYQRAKIDFRMQGIEHSPKLHFNRLQKRGFDSWNEGHCIPRLELT
jgi:hypothetical protein